MKNTASAPSKVLSGDVYTFGPGRLECMKHPSETWGGGIGLRTSSAKCYDYTSFSKARLSCDCLSASDAICMPHLRNFVSMMGYVDEGVRFYYTTDRPRVRRYVRDYLDAFLTAAHANEIEDMIDDYLSWHGHAGSGYDMDIVVGTLFFNDLFYSTSWKAAQALFTEDAINSLLSSFPLIRGDNPLLPYFKTFVNRFDGGETLRFVFDVDDGRCRLDDTLFVFSKDFHCSENEYQRSLAPYTLFLSNWTVILACWMCMHEFGQCAFGLYWETGNLAILQEGQREAWQRTHHR